MFSYRSIKITSLLILGVGIVGNCYAQQPTEVIPASLTINDAVRIALDKNNSVLLAREEVAAAKDRIGEARSESYPQIAVQSQYTHFSEVPVFELPSTTGPSTIIALIPPDNIVSSISARQALYTGGKISGGISKAEALYDLSLSRLGTVRTQVALQTRQAYYSVLLNEALVKSATDNLSAAQKQLDDATAKFDAGTAAKFDVLRSQTQVSEAQQTLVQTKNQVEISRVALNRVVGSPLSTSYKLTDPELAPLPKDAVQTLIDAAERQRAEILSARAQVRATDYGIKVARSAGLPQLGLTVSGQKVQHENASGVSGWTFIAGVSQEIFDGGRIRSSIKEAKSLKGEAEINLADATQGVEQAVRQAYLNLQTARQTIDTATARLAQASEAYDVATVRYESGVGTATELTDSFAALTQARTSVDTSHFNYSILFATLQRAIGLSTY